MLCYDSSPQFVNVRFINNFSDNGGALYLEGTSMDISFTDCQFIDNYAFNGGAVQVLYGTSISFTRCLFEGNHLTGGQGSAIRCYGAPLTIDCCTFADNDSDIGPTLILIDNPTVFNSSIFAFNECNQPVRSIGSTTLDVSYTDVYGNSEGDWIGPLAGMDGVDGNICEDPLFENAPADDFHLTAASPCVDAGDPQLPLDPDDTVADMGAFYYPHDTTPLSIWLDTANDPWYIPANGGTVTFTATISNNLDTPVTFQGWTMVTTPSGNTVGPLMGRNVSLPAGGELVTGTLAQQVPGWAPVGEYTFTANVGLYPGTVVASDQLSIIKVGTVGEREGSTEDWAELSSGWDAASNGSEFGQPASFELGAAYPNPFNPATTLSVTLPEAAELNVRVFNVAGQQVAELASGQFSAGRHTLTFDASGLASGLYFVRATVPGQMNQVQKVMLVQ